VAARRRRRGAGGAAAVRRGGGCGAAVVNVARTMRHDGMRLVVSTQSPRALARELLELVSVAVLHRFHSRDWFAHLEKKLPLAEADWARLATLQPGHALVFASRHHVAAAADGHVMGLRVRPRITADRGSSRTNAAARLAAEAGETCEA
jgi:hypothetical protein